MADKLNGIFECVFAIAFLFVVIGLMSALLYVSSGLVVGYFIPDGLEGSADTCNHDWNVVDDNVGLYGGYEVYCPVCGDERTCRVKEWKKYLVDNGNVGKAGE